MKVYQPICALSLLITSLHAPAAEEYVMGTYNVRIATDTDGEKLWSNRKEYVAKTIYDAGFDVVGLTEILDGEQRTDIETLLPDYDTDIVLVYSGSGKKQMNGVAWLKSKFELLDKGMYYLSPDVTSSSRKFPGASQSRGTVWVKLKSKSSSDVFYFFSCHLNRNEHAQAQKEGTTVNIEQVRHIAGNYPIVFAGDLNSGLNTTYVAPIMKSFLSCAQEVSESVPPASSLTTISYWDTSITNKYQFDYVYVRNVDVLTCSTFNDTYGRTISPSDHLPFRITCRIQTPNLNRARYVDASVSDDIADGSKAHPYASLEKAIADISSGDTIYIAKGEYHAPSESYRFTQSASVIGGYDNEFKNVIGHSLLTKANEGEGRVITVDAPYFLDMSGCDITAGNEINGDGGGILCNGIRLSLTDCTVSGNRATNGAGISAVNDLLLSNCTITDNIATAKGGALYIATNANWKHIFSNCEISNNGATTGAAAYIIGGRSGYWLANSIHSNNTNDGSLLHISNTAAAGVVNFINNTIATNNGALSFTLPDDGLLTLVNNTITGNSSALSAIINMASGKLSLHNNIIVGNSPANISLTGTLAATAYNIYPTASAVSFSLKASDIVANDETESLTETVAMLGGEISNGKFIPELSTDGSVTPYISIKTPLFCNKAVNALPYRELNEYVLNADCDNDFRTATFTYLLTDQIGVTRPSDSNATIGAVEYTTSSSGIDRIIPDLGDIKIKNLTSGSITIEMPYSRIISNVDPTHYSCNIYSVSGTQVRNLGNISHGISTIEFVPLPKGIYFLHIVGGTTLKFYIE
jgi:endonuclease/exonuclease/phosphatase family metal-dependent hydrolase